AAKPELAVAPGQCLLLRGFGFSENPSIALALGSSWPPAVPESESVISGPSFITDCGVTLPDLRCPERLAGTRLLDVTGLAPRAATGAAGATDRAEARNFAPISGTLSAAIATPMITTFSTLLVTISQFLPADTGLFERNAGSKLT